MMRLEQKALYVNIIVNVFVAIVKIGGGLFFRTFTLLIDGIYTVNDLVTDVIALLGIKIGRKRANKNHPYGYGRVFYIIELFMGILSFMVGIFVIYLSFKTHYHKPPLEVIFLIIGIVILKMLSAKNLEKIGKKRKSELLIVSGYESLMEAYSSLGLIVIIVFSFFIPKVDILGGIFIAFLLIWQALKTIWQNIILLIGITFEDDTIKKRVKMVVDKYRVINITDIILIKDGPYYELTLVFRPKRNVKVKSLLRVQSKIKKELKVKNWGIKFIMFQLT